jgi:hypothetical protein
LVAALPRHIVPILMPEEFVALFIDQIRTVMPARPASAQVRRRA